MWSLPRETSENPETLAASGRRADDIPSRMTIPPESLPEPDTATVPPFTESSLKCTTFRPGSALVSNAGLHPGPG